MPATCYLEGLFAGTLCITPGLALELKERGVIAKGKELGYFTLVEDEEVLWKILREVE